MNSLPKIKTLSFLKHYKSSKDDKKQVMIRARIYSTMVGKVALDKTIDIKLMTVDDLPVRVTKSEFSHKTGHELLKFRLPETESLVMKAIYRLLREHKEINTENLYQYTYHPTRETNASGEEMIDNADVQKMFGYPVPVKVWETLISETFRDEQTGETVLFEELEDIAHNIESDYYGKLRKEEIEKMDFNERYKKGEYDKNNIFECFGYCWSKHPKKDEPLIANSYKSLLLRLYDYRFNGNPSTRTIDFDDKWIDGFLMFLVSEGYSLLHLKNYDPFSLSRHKIKFIKADRKPYRFGAFEKIVKHFKHYIYLLQKYNIITYNRNPNFINARDYIARNVNTTGYTRKEHSLTKEEFSLLCKKDFNNDTHNLARDMFIIAVLAGGLRGEEFYNGKFTVEKRNGEYVLNIYYSKTQSNICNPVFGQLVDIIERYNGDLPKFLPLDQFRVALKEIAKILEFNRIIISPYTFLDESGKQTENVLSDIFSVYFARKTLISLLDGAGMAEEDIIEFSSHSKIETLKHYKGKLSLENKIAVLRKLDINNL